ncbi:MAG: TraR/DksA family transcriptional regulator [Treponema sp.]|jgi:RNA polymerase-binding protein DksA|nr:TraR/DksA family transcriptional regulator [Treponema sp.]
MDKKFLEKMKVALLEKKEDILNQLAAANSDFKQMLERMGGKDEIDVATDVADRQLMESVGEKELNRLKAIENALNRIEQGKYGICMKCAKKIPEERLKILPYAVLCIDCKSADERRNR